MSGARRDGGWQPTPYIRLFRSKARERYGAVLRQWWENSRGQGEWRPIDLMVEAPGWQGDPRTTPANTVIDKPVDKEEAR